MISRFTFLAAFLFSTSAWSFPENVRHGYFSCTACHVSPSGGGVLTPYGRALSAELMSTWGTPKTAGFLFTDVENEKINPPWFRAQALLRGVQTRRNTPTVDQARFIPMQADLEVGVDLEKFAVILTGGFRAKPGATTSDLNEFFSRKHYVLYRFSDAIVARAGKFIFAFGLNGPDHITATRRGLGWDQGSETYNLEANYFLEKSTTTLTLVSKSPEENNIQKISGIALNQSFFVGGDSRLGFSGFSGSQEIYERIVYGPYLTWAITKQVFLDSEFFLQDKKIKSSSAHEKGYATFHRLGWEISKGIIPFTQFDRSFLNDSDDTSRFDSYGVGLQWLPYPHFETTAFLGKEKAASQPENDLWWLMFNLYL